MCGTTPQAPISKFTPREMTAAEVEQTIRDYAHCALLAKEAGCVGPSSACARVWLHVLVRLCSHVHVEDRLLHSLLVK